MKSNRVLVICFLLLFESGRDRLRIRAAAAATPENLLQNGSFEEGDASSKSSFMLIIYAPNSSITGWFVSYGSVDWDRHQLPQTASDCSPTFMDLSGASPGIITTSFRANAQTTYSVLLDSTANLGAPTPVIGNFSVSVLDLYSRTVLNSSVVNVNASGHGSQNVGWRTSSLTFTASAAAASIVNLTLTSNIDGIYGPLIDNVRVYEGLFFPSKASESSASCESVNPTPAPEGTLQQPDGISKASMVAIIAVPTVSIIALCIILFWWRQRKVAASRGLKAVLHMEGEAQIFPYKVLKTATRNFHPENRLGEGGFGAVFKGVLLDGTEVAVKKLSPKSHQGQQEFANEVTLISRVQHRNLVKLNGCCIEGNERILVYEFLENKSVSQALLDPKQAVDLDWPTRFKIAVGTARGLAYLHQDSQPRILHRDIKASNILLDKNFEAKIADFGLAKFFANDLTHVSTRVAGTVGYMAPEYAMRGLLTDKADVFSFGVVALELVSGRPNLDNSVPEDERYLLNWARQLQDENRILHLIDPKLQEHGYNKDEVLLLISVALLCTQQTPAKRPTMTCALTKLTGEATTNIDSLTANTESTFAPLLHFQGISESSTTSFSVGSSVNSNSSSSY